MAAALLAGGCGSENRSAGATTATTSAEPTASIPKAPPPPADATTPSTVTESATTPTSTNPEQQPGGAGDEQPIRVPADFRIGSGGMTPASVSVPAFLAVQVTIVSADGKAHTVVLATPKPRTIEVPAGGRASVRLPGLRPGRYALRPTDDVGGAVVVAGGEPGP